MEANMDFSSGIRFTKETLLREIIYLAKKIKEEKGSTDYTLSFILQSYATTYKLLFGEIES